MKKNVFSKSNNRFDIPREKYNMYNPTLLQYLFC